MHMYLRQVRGRGHRTHEPYHSAFTALPLSYSLERIALIFLFFIEATKLKHNQQKEK